MTLNILKIIPDTIVDGPGIRTSLYLSGCFHCCPGCHNKYSWKENSGEDMEFEVILDRIKEFEHNKITISGGDGLCYQSENLIEFLKYLKSELPSINIWLYTGFLYENILCDPKRHKILPFIDVLCDGPFIESKKSPNKLWIGSENQRVIDVRKSLDLGEIILFN